MFKQITKKQSERSRGSRVEGHLDVCDGGTISGWASNGSSNGSVELRVLVNGREVERFVPDEHRPDLVAHGYPADNRLGFRRTIDIHSGMRKNDASFRCSVQDADSGRELVGSPVTLPEPSVVGHIDRVSDGSIEGWAHDRHFNEVTLRLDMYWNGTQIGTVRADQYRSDLAAAGISTGHAGFYFDFSSYVGPTEFGTLKLCLSGSDIEVLAPGYEVEPSAAKIAALLEVAAWAKKRALVGDGSAAWLSDVFIPQMVTEARASKGKSLPARTSSDLRTRLGSHGPRNIDVIVPVYEGWKETMSCVESILNVDSQYNVRLILVNDKSPNDRLTKDLRNLAGPQKLILLENDRNVGFVTSVNRALAETSHADVLILNSDTLMPKGGLDQLVDAAYSERNIGTVTPFSNNATILSFPAAHEDNVLPVGYDVDTLNQVFRICNKNTVVDIPTAHGFCMYVKRQVFDEIGHFRGGLWGRGYGEENDFSMLARTRGWRHVAATDTFVQHYGSVSFRDDAQDLKEQNGAKLDALFPEYRVLVQDFIREDPLRTHRNRVSEELIARELKRREVHGVVAFVSHTLGGGAQVAQDDLAELLERESVEVLFLTRKSETLWRVRHSRSALSIDFDIASEWDALVSTLRLFSVGHIHFHQVMEFSAHIWDLPERLGVSYDVTIHDYYTVCPRVNLVDDSGGYCGEPPVTGCNLCVQTGQLAREAESQLERFKYDVQRWRDFYAERLAGARRVFVPSGDAHKRVQRYFRLGNVVLKPHPFPTIRAKFRPIERRDQVRVAVVGAIGPHKGIGRLKEVARYATRFQLPIKLFVIGYTSEDDELRKLDTVHIVGKYRRSDLSVLLKSYGCEIALFLSVCPETYCFTLTEVMAHGIRPVVFDLGAQAERVRLLVGEQYVVASETGAGDICKKLLEIVENEGRASEFVLEVGEEYEGTLDDYYELAWKK